MKSYRYETVVVFATDMDEAGVNAQIDRIETVVRAHNGSIEKRDIWGRRELAYKIGKRTHGIYCCLVYSGDATLVADLDRQLKINESVLRHLIVEKDAYAPDWAPGRRLDDTMPLDGGLTFPAGGTETPEETPAPQ